jgi:hypothetical protein
MFQDTNDDPLKELEAALLVAPSPEFAARVRERVRRDEPATSSWGWWRLAAAGVVMALIGVASLTMWRRESKPPAAMVAATGPTVAIEQAAPVAPVTKQENDSVASALVSTKPISRTHTPAARAIAVHASTVSREPEVLVPPDEGIAIRRLLLAIREGWATVPPPGLRVMEDVDGHLLEPAPIDIPLIKIEPLPGTPAPDSGGIVK